MAGDPRFEELKRLGVDEPVVAALEASVRDDPDEALARINPLAFAQAHRLDPTALIGAFLRASKLGLFDLVWSIHCPRCKRMLWSHASARQVKEWTYYCAWCDVQTEATLDERVEVTFAVNPRIRKLKEALTPRQWIVPNLSSCVKLDAAGQQIIEDATRDLVALKPGEVCSVQVEVGPRPVVVNDMTLHGTAVLMEDGPAAEGVQELEVVLNGRPSRAVTKLRPGRVALRIHNGSSQTLVVWVLQTSEALRTTLQVKGPFLGGKRLFVHPVFRELYRTDALDVDQRLKLESLTVLFTDLKGSTELYERVGDLTAFGLVRKHSEVLESAIASEGGSIVKTIGDAVMATFTEPAAAMAAALKMRAGLSEFNQRGPSDLLIKIGLHDGPCLAVMLNERLDYFGQTVNIAARVQGIAEPQAILATAPVLKGRGVTDVLGQHGLTPHERKAELKGISGAVTVFEIA